MNRKPYLLYILALIAIGAFVFTACSPPTSPVSDTGMLQIALANNINARTLAPTTDMNPASYAITGTGPSSATFSAATTGAVVTKNSLAIGAWTVVVNATNAAGVLIGTGTSSAQVNTGATTSVAVTVSPVSGTGTLSLAISWPASQVSTPSISASLAPALGASQALAFTISGAGASYLNAAVPTGYYTLTLTLLDNGIAVAGSADVVRIVAGQTTSGTYAITNVNSPGGSVAVTINPNLQNPLALSIAGAQTNQLAGSTQTLAASVSNYTGSVVYGWYVNGVVQAATASNFVFGAGMAAGYYQIDVTAYNSDRSQAGSATQLVQVTAATGLGPAAVNLGTAGNYAILSEAGITTTGTTAIVGDMGVSPIAATAVTGFGLILDSSNQFSNSTLVTGHVYAANYAAPTPANLITAVSSMEAAYADAAGRTLPDHLNLGGGALSGDTLAPGLYNWGSAVSITSGITISGGPNDVWIFQVGGALSVANGAIITLAGGALPQNIFWQVAGVASLGTTAQMKGVILSSTAITLNTGASIDGRLLAQTAVTLISNAVTQP